MPKAKELKGRLSPYVVTKGKRFSLKECDTDARGWKMSKEEMEAALQQGVVRLGQLQEKLYAQDQWGVLLIFQAMDAAGKDGAIKHVMSGINPQGCQVYSFKSPSPEELDHDFMWRTSKALPERGRIGIFNRSYYEETLVVRVHPEYLQHQRLPSQVIGKRIWKERFEDINAFERYMSRNGFVIRKFFLNVSKNEQRRRFLERIEMNQKNWKFSGADVKERGFWDQYMAAYEDMIRKTATEYAPWVVVPADNKRFARLVVAGAVIDALSDLKLHFPEVSAAQKAELSRVRLALERE
jgi:PPK2 family polyphosphate:nucleotide phosphotransferase